MEAHPSHAAPSLKSKDSYSHKDLMISYSHADNEIMIKLRESLERNGISVWVDVSGLQAGVDFLSKIGEAIIDCKLFISLLSKTSIVSKYCKDELALAYVSDRAIFPVSLDKPEELYPLMDTGMKLQLAGYDWTMLERDPNLFDERFAKLLELLRKECDRQQNENTKNESAEVEAEKSNKEGTSGTSEKSRPTLQRQKTRDNIQKKNKKQESKEQLGVEDLEPERYWKERFGNKDKVTWTSFAEQFKKDFKNQLNALFSDEDQEWLMMVLLREMEVEEDELFKYNLLAFCNVEGNYLPLWDRVNEQARESWSMKEVFDMDSSVRVEAIENLGKFRSAAVIDALRDLLADTDANIRAVAAVSLARTNASDPVTTKFLMKTLNDKDRLVREAGCLALGHLQVKPAVNKLLHLWRNDVISHVREAANVALSQIGGPEVEKQMRVTKVLADEIRKLTTS